MIPSDGEYLTMGKKATKWGIKKYDDDDNKTNINEERRCEGWGVCFVNRRRGARGDK